MSFCRFLHAGSQELWMLQFSTDFVITKRKINHGFKGMLGFDQNDLRGAVSSGQMQSTG